MQTNTNLTKLKWKLTPEKKKEIVARYCSGERPSFIAREIEIDHSTVYYYLKKENVFRGNSKSTRSTKKIITVIENDSIVSKVETNIFHFEDEPVCEGHDYEYYLRLENSRRLRKSNVL